jgi:hypothetical protein
MKLVRKKLENQPVMAGQLWGECLWYFVNCDLTGRAQRHGRQHHPSIPQKGPIPAGDLWVG